MQSCLVLQNENSACETFPHSDSHQIQVGLDFTFFAREICAFKPFALLNLFDVASLHLPPSKHHCHICTHAAKYHWQLRLVLIFKHLACQTKTASTEMETRVCDLDSSRT